MTTIRNNLQSVKARIEAACAAAHRAVNEVTLLAVSKTFPAAAVRAAHAAGATAFGENYIQEALEKQAGLADLGTRRVDAHDKHAWMLRSHLE